MVTLVFKCETITPMFLSGADGRTPELRPPSIKGAMRFWWRAIHPNLSLEELRKKEGEIFGSTDEKVGRSKFGVRIRGSKMEKEDCRPLPHSVNRTFTNPAYNANSTYNLVIQTDKKHMEYLKNIFHITTILGGFGKRNRRGFGSVHIIEINGRKNEMSLTSENILKLLDSINPGIFQKSGSLIEIIAKTTSKYPYIKKIEIANKTDCMYELLKNIGESSHKNDCDDTGFVDTRTKKRFASPIYVSVIKNGASLFPIVTTLNREFPPGWVSSHKDKSDDFIKEILL